MSTIEALSSNSPIERATIIGKKLVATVVAQAALFATPLAFRGMYDTSPEAPPSVLQTAKTYDLDVVLVDAGGTDKKYTDEEITQQVQDAAEALSATTDDSVRFGDIDFDHITLLPAGEGGAVRPEKCYGTDEIRKEMGKYEAQRRLGAQTMTLFVLNELSGCDHGAGAVAFMGTRLSYYNQASAKNFLHELGHNWGNGHQMVIDCTTPAPTADDKASRRVLFYHAESISKSFKKGCGLQRDVSGKVNEYSSPSSVMGYANSRISSQFYTPNELNRINPERFKMLELSNPYGRHYLSMKEGGVMGIKIPLPPGHALKGIRDMFRPVPYLPIDEDISAISFGLQYKDKGGEIGCGNDITNPAADYDIQPIALGKTQSYVLNTQMFDQLPLYPRDGDERAMVRPQYMQKPIIYMDEQLDLVVSIGRDQDRNFAPFVEVRRYSETALSREILSEEVAKRNKQVFGSSAH